MIERIRLLIRWAIERLNRIFPVWLVPWVAAGFGLLTFALWLLEHDAQVRQGYELGQLKKQTATQVSAFQAQAEAAIRGANQQNAQAVRDLESRERKFAQEANGLRQQVAALRHAEQAKLDQVATLPASELATRAASGLGLAPAGLARAGTLPAAAPLADKAPDSQGSALGNPPGGPSRQDGSLFEMDENALRKVDAALVELDSCRDRDAVTSKQIDNLNNQLLTSAATISQQSASIEKLNQAVHAKDQVLAQTNAEHRAELKAVRGSLLGRAGRVMEHIAIGVVIGVLLR